ncbi:DUF5996 family protein [Aequorivita antarctica]|uniref:Ava_C0101 and related proteins n=1 Tax=Aequorivita antarctica TaxID=153266 RepID=A0A5C6Z2K5_9FLAO|nr:DUF5996 family protein [Aequorivita antarctica]TXD74347.1 hypothetical protein ESU54_03595 [Aequorivita antarctica]SRX73698.1 hypothetical protein AEQU3_01130 [Aequorivita antarctica]
MGNEKNWPVLNFAEMQDTIETLHQWIQIVGKIRLKTMPWQNHSWHTTLYITPTGYSTNAISFEGRIFQIDFNFKTHKLLIQCSNAETVTMDLKPRTVASFYEELFEKLASIGLAIRIHASPNEMEPAIPFAENVINKAYNPEVANALWRAMVKVNAVFLEFRSEFIGKASPVHLFWGAFDLAVTRFSGKPAPLHQGGMPNMPLDVMQEAYSQEVCSAGFWPGSKDSPIPVFYAYAYPSDARFGEQKVLPKEAFYSPEMGEFFLKYEDVQTSDNPEKNLHDFLQTTYIAATKTSKWDRTSLEKM